MTLGLNCFLQFVQSSSTRDLRNELAIEMPDKQTRVVAVDTEELRPTTSNKRPPRCSLPLNIDRTLCVEKNAKEAGTASECVQKLVLSTSNTRSLPSTDEETVNLSEPQFESFCVPNLSPHCNH